MFAIPRTVGWLAQWQEMLQDPEQKIARPRQIYTGPKRRDVVPIEQRTGATQAEKAQQGARA
jgi:citrate synthase